jgi:hypothetical protein
MKSRKTLGLLPAILLAASLVSACGSSTTPVAQIPATDTLPPSEATRLTGKCGDGVCDEAEQANPALCPIDCPSTPLPTGEPPTATPPPSPTPVPATSTREPGAAPSPMSTPPPPAQSPVPGGKCGDGICDEMEQKDPALCPADCAGEDGPTGVPATGVPDYEPPISIALILHIDPLGMQGAQTFKPEEGMYALTRNEIDWLAEEAARHQLHFTALYNGWYPQWALETNDLSQFETLLAAGHEIGSHAHRLTYDPAQGLWVSHIEEVDRYGRPNYDAALANQCWADAHRYVDAVLDQIGTADQNQTMCGVPFKCSDEGQLMAEFGFAIAAGNRSEKGSFYFGHIVWNPWRPAASDEPGHELEEDPAAGYIAVDHLAQIGSQEAHGMDLSIPQLQRRFLMLYVEWLARERRGAEDRVWTFGFVYHPNQGDRYNADLTEFLDWLDEYFVGKESPDGHTIARYATVGEIAREFTTWEAAHPGASSFDYVRGDPYPYTYAMVSTLLEGAGYEAHVNLGQGETCFRLSREGYPIYLLWSDVGEQEIDFSAQLSGQVRVTTAGGEERILEAAALPLTGEPVIVQPLE